MWYLDLAAFDGSESADVEDGCLAGAFLELHWADFGSRDADASGVAQRYVRIGNKQPVC